MRDAQVVASDDQAPANAPRQPVRARQRALPVPPAALVELAQIDQQAMRGRIQMRGLLCNPFAQLLELTVHADYVSSRSDMQWHKVPEAHQMAMGVTRPSAHSVSSIDCDGIATLHRGLHFALQAANTRRWCGHEDPADWPAQGNAGRQSTVPMLAGVLLPAQCDRERSSFLVRIFKISSRSPVRCTGAVGSGMGML